MAADLNTIREIADRVATAQGVEVVDVELRGGGKARTLRITIDKPEGVTHEDCAMVSRDVSTILDVEDAVSGALYTLEVSSPGLDRALKRPEDYRRFTGSRLKLTTREPVNGNRHFEARLQRFEEGKLILETIKGKKKPKPGHAQPVQHLRLIWRTWKRLTWYRKFRYRVIALGIRIRKDISGVDYCNSFGILVEGAGVGHRNW